MPWTKPKIIHTRTLKKESRASLSRRLALGVARTKRLEETIDKALALLRDTKGIDVSCDCVMCSVLAILESGLAESDE